MSTPHSTAPATTGGPSDCASVMPPASTSAAPDSSSASASVTADGREVEVTCVQPPPASRVSVPADDEEGLIAQNHSKQVKVKFVATTKRPKTAWAWQYFVEFKPAVMGRTVMCCVLVRKNGKDVRCGHTVKWTSSNGTKGLSDHVKKAHRNEYLRVMDQQTQTVDMKREVAQAAGGRDTLLCFLPCLYCVTAG